LSGCFRPLAGLLLGPIAVLSALEATAPAEEVERPWRHEFLLHEGVEDFARGTLLDAELSRDPAGVAFVPAGEGEYTSPVIETEAPFEELILSWNVDCPAGLGFRVELRVGKEDRGSWSPFLHVDDWGPAGSEPEGRRQCPEGKIDVDYFRSQERFDRLQYRIRELPRSRLTRTAGLEKAHVRIERVAVVASRRVAPGDRGDRTPSLERPGENEAQPLLGGWSRRLDVPFRSQRNEDPAIAGRICSPTSVAMALEYRGRKATTGEVASRSFDPRHDIYGNWPHAVQAAYGYGVRGYVRRFSRWSEVKESIEADRPLVASIRVEEGELTGAPYRKTDGHLLVIAGFDGKGGVHVLDPAASTAAEGVRTYAAGEMERVWFARGGTAYVFLAR
jgi:hypothetical protein